MTIYNVNSQILIFCPRFLLNQRWKSLSLCPAAPFLDVSVWSSTGNTIRRCRCRRVGFETNSSSIAVRWGNGGDTFPVRFPANKKIRRIPRGESETPPSDFRHGGTCPYWRWTCGATVITNTDICSVRLYLQLFVGWLMPYSRYLCLFAYSGVQHILCCVFVLFFFVLCTLYIFASFSGLFNFVCPFGIL